ncbi:hypothetical protein [Actinokineospora enzanensis]|uniref:hypothetical protein n=1 Tax=Actinokineospora enzanensis TaxID=155975 RepID=UPI00038143A8|nr:hypothetical protein [Actinokineospora enzanensis]
MTAEKSGQAVRTPDAAVWRGVSHFLDAYVKVGDGDHVVLVYTLDGREAAAWLATELSLRGHRAVTVGMNPVRDDGLEARLRAVLPDPARVGPASRLVLLTVERESMSHGIKLRRVLAPYPERDCAVFRLINAAVEFFVDAVSLTPEQLSGVNGALLNRMMPASRLHIGTTAGTDLDVEIDSERYRWLSNRGVWREGSFVILPPGEVSTYPANINGILVADGAFNVTAYTTTDARLGAHPVVIEIEEGRVVDYRCDSPALMTLLGRCLERENGDRVGELGFGTNFGIDGFIPMNSHINERHPGVHLGLGQHGQKFDAVPYMCDIHLDLITADTTVVVEDGATIRSRDLADLPGEDHPKPLHGEVDDEDIDGDCCGVIATEVARARAEYLSLDRG